MTKKERLSSTRLEEWKKSGLSQRRYCEERQLSLSTFRWWRSRLREPGSSAGQPTSFVELPVPQTSRHEAAENGSPITVAAPGKQARVFLRPGPTDMRKQINGLAVLVEQELELNLFSEAVFLFRKRERRILKALFWDRTGFCLWHKRLEKHRFPWPERTEDVVREIDAERLAMLLSDIDFWSAHQRLDYRRIS